MYFGLKYVPRFESSYLEHTVSQEIDNWGLLYLQQYYQTTKYQLYTSPHVGELTSQIFMAKKRHFHVFWLKICASL